MSKTDELRAMREAKYARARAATGRAPLTPNAPATTPPVAPAAAKAAKPAKPADATAEPATDALCGHRNMSGRTCTREQGHAAKSHRYS
ncbi:hypothetical protein [Nocardioides rubriscoriae]|uniref:hypothetical protein n=1 Tax=Nocardioides rubriscoriae TaxID=642762 RepID=UPI0011DFD657|nr:hypothetical protein [Nocardioides rubriscoriae]